MLRKVTEAKARVEGEGTEGVGGGHLMHAGPAGEQHHGDEVGESGEQAEEGTQAVLVDGEQADGTRGLVGVRVRVRVKGER